MSSPGPVRQPLPLRLLDRLEETLIVSLMAAATLIIFAAVVHRYGLGLVADVIGYARRSEIDWLGQGARSVYTAMRGVNLVWAQEVCIYLFVWMAKFGAAYGVRTGIHVGVDVLINRLSPRRRAGFVLFGLCAGALFTGVVGTFGAQLVWDSYNGDTTSADLEIRMWIIYLAIPLGSYLMCFRFLQVAWLFLRTGELPHHDQGQVEGIDPDAAAVTASPMTPKEP